MLARLSDAPQANPPAGAWHAQRLARRLQEAAGRKRQAAAQRTLLWWPTLLLAPPPLLAPPQTGCQSRRPAAAPPRRPPPPPPTGCEGCSAARAGTWPPLETPQCCSAGGPAPRLLRLQRGRTPAALLPPSPPRTPLPALPGLAPAAAGLRRPGWVHPAAAAAAAGSSGLPDQWELLCCYLKWSARELQLAAAAAAPLSESAAAACWRPPLTLGGAVARRPAARAARTDW